MPRFLKILVALVATALLLGLALLAALIAFVDPDDYRDDIAQLVESQTGRRLGLAGLSLSLWPCCAIELADAALGNPPGFPDRPFMRAGTARLRFAVWPLLTRGELVIGRIVLDGFAVDLVRDADGRGNWQFDGGAQPDDDGPGDGAGPGEPPVLKLAGLTLTDGRISYTAAPGGQAVRIEPLQLELGAIEGGAPFPLQGAFGFVDEAAGHRVDVTLKTTLAAGEGVDRVALSALATTVAGTLAGDMPLALRLTAPRGVLSLADDIGLDLESFSASVEALGGGTLAVEGRGRVAARPALDGTLDVTGLAPRALLAVAGTALQTTDPAVLTRLAGRGRWQLDAGALALEDLDVTLDDTRFTGRVRYPWAPGAALRLELALDDIDIDRYLAPDGAATEPDGEGAAALPTPPAAGAQASPFEALRGPTLAGRIDIARLRVAGLRLEGLSAPLELRDGRLRIEPLGAQLYGGRVAGRAALDVTRDEARLTLRQQLDGLDLGRFLADFAGIDNITGTTRLGLDVEARGNDAGALLRSLSGELTLGVADGVYRGMDLWHEVRRARAVLRREPVPPAAESPQTALQRVELAGPVRDGRFTSRTFLAEIPFMRLSGALAIDLPAETLDGRLEARIVETPVFDDGTALPDLVGVRIPLTVEGPLDGPKVRPDLDNMVTDAVRESAREALRDRARKFLDRLGGTPQDPAPAPTDGEAPQAAPDEAEDPVRETLDRLFKKR